MAAFIRLSADHAAIDSAGVVLKATDHALAVEAETVLIEAQEAAAAIAADAEARAAALIAEAEAHATSLKEEAEAIRAEAETKGHEEGLEAAKIEIAEHMLLLVERSIDYLSGTERMVADAVLLCLRRVLDEFPDEDLVVRQARAALHVVRAEPHVILRVAPEIEETLRARVAEILRGNPEFSYLEVVGDAALSSGGCRLETEAGVVDASLEVQIAALEKAVRGAVGDGRSGDDTDGTIAP